MIRRSRPGPVLADSKGGSDFILDGALYTSAANVSQVPLGDGDRVLVAPTKGRRRQMVILGSPAGATRRKLAHSPFGGLQLALWPDCTGSPYCNRGPLLTCAAPQWDGAATTIDTLPRYYYSGALQATVAEGETAPTLANLLSWEGVTLLDSHPSTSLPRAAVTVSLYDGTGGSLIGQLLREYQLEEGSWTQTGEWVHIAADPIGSLPTNNAQRRQGYLFYDKASDTYTIAAADGLLLATRGNEPTPTLCAWDTAYGALPGNSSVSVAGAYAIAGAYQGVDLAFDPASDAAVDLYARGETEWQHVAQVVLGNKISGADLYLGCGDWDPYSSAGDELIQENTRWPYLSGEWLVWVCAQGGGDSFGFPTQAGAKLLGIRASDGNVRTIHDLTAPLHKKTPIDATTLQATLEASLTYNGILHVGDWVSIGAGEFSNNQGAIRRDNNVSFASAGYGADYPPPLGYGTSYAQDLTVWSGTFSDATDPTVAPASPRLACASTDLLSDQESHFPRGAVSGSNYFSILREPAWLASDTATVDIPTASYAYDHYEDVDSGDFAGGTPGTPIRIYIHERAMESAGFDYRANTNFRPVLRSYNSITVLDSLDLTREFEESGDKYYQEPLIWEYGVTGDYVWILASDWTAFDTQKLSMILVNKTSLVQTTTLDLSVEAGADFAAGNGRPQLIVGTDGTGPWAHVMAWFGGNWKVLEVRYNSPSLVASTVVSSGSSSTFPDQFGESINLAISPLKQFWIEAGADLKVREE